MRQPTRIDVFSELTSPKGTFDYDMCCQLLGDNYDNFVRFCEAARLIPEDIDTMDVLEISPERHKVIFEVSLVSGEKMQFET
jgi:hypothetical protein